MYINTVEFLFRQICSFFYIIVYGDHKAFTKISVSRKRWDSLFYQLITVIRLSFCVPSPCTILFFLSGRNSSYICIPFLSYIFFTCSKVSWSFAITGTQYSLFILGFTFITIPEIPLAFPILGLLISMTHVFIFFLLILLEHNL